MITKTALRTGAAAVAVAGATGVSAVLVGTASGAPHTRLHLPAPLHVVSRVTGTVVPAHGHTVISSSLTKPRTRHTLGSGVATCVTSNDPAVLKCTSGFALAKGILVAKETINSREGRVSGKVISGSGEYEGIGGTIRGKALSNGVVKFTIYYSVR
ncbi:MAG TPA: hypothetical protein VHE57_10085 [Mycobacteriales bacterium]|nr:hypothetical protein [Mycobacteriales bacterium]